MTRRLIAAFSFIFLSLSSLPAQAMNCVAYVRSVTGFDLSGDAWQWWPSAEGIYARTHAPRPGAVMVFSRTREMWHGHVAVVRKIVDSRHIRIDQANWVVGHHRGLITKNVAVEDVSSNNDWTEVRVEWLRSGTFGRVNAVSGFILPDGDSYSGFTQATYLTHQSHLGHHVARCAIHRIGHHGHRSHGISESRSNASRVHRERPETTPAAFRPVSPVTHHHLHTHHVHGHAAHHAVVKVAQKQAGKHPHHPAIAVSNKHRMPVQRTVIADNLAN